MKSQMTIGKKLFLSFGTALALLLVVGFLSLHDIDNLGGMIDKLSDVNGKKLFLSGQIEVEAAEGASLERGILVRSYMKDKPSIEKYNQSFADSHAKLTKYLEQFVSLVETEEGRRAVAQIQSAETDIQQNHQEMMRLIGNSETEAAVNFFVQKALPRQVEVSTIADRLSDQQAEIMAETNKVSDAAISQSRWIIIIMIGLSILVAAGVVFLVRQINRALRRAVGELSAGAEQVAAAASQVSSSSQSLAQGASEQAASLEETSASSAQVSAMAQRTSENSGTAATLVTGSEQKFSEANQSLEQTEKAMAEISSQSSKISNIIKTIDEIAFQTNIVALNAAVEAARAGEAGMGFAVVADEVRNLAQRCAQAARDTSALIEESIAKSNDGQTKVDQVAVAIRVVTRESAKVKTWWTR